MPLTDQQINNIVERTVERVTSAVSSDSRMAVIVERAAERAVSLITDKHLNMIAEKASIKTADLLTMQLFAGAGKRIMIGFFKLVGIIALGLSAWLYSNGYVK